MLEGERSRQKEENTGGQTPRGYPGQALSVGPAESSGLCLVIDISNQIELSKSDEACLFKNAHFRAIRRFGNFEGTVLRFGRSASQSAQISLRLFPRSCKLR